MPDDYTPDGTESVMRIGCGGAFGLLLGASLLLFDPLGSKGANIGFLIVFALVCALLAWRFGDRFWHWVKELFSRWSWF